MTLLNKMQLRTSLTFIAMSVPVICVMVFDCSDTAAAQNKGYWSEASRTFATTAHGNVVAVVAHNCYSADSENSIENAKATVAKVHAAQSAGADIIELDVCNEGNEVYVVHDDDGRKSVAKLADVLKDEKLRAGDQILYIELKETRPTAKSIRVLLNCVMESGVAKSGRPIVFRAFGDRRKNLKLIQTALKNKTFANLQGFVRFHELIRNDQQTTLADTQRQILKAKKAGFHGIELQYQSSNLFTKITYAKSLGLGVGVFTIPIRFGDVFVAAVREDVDSIVVDYPMDRTRIRIEDKNGLIYLNCWSLRKEVTSIPYLGLPGEKRRADLQPELSPPILRAGDVGQPMFGSALVFDGRRSLTLYDADSPREFGYLANATVSFVSTEIGEGKAQSIFSKTDNAGFGLELFNPNGEQETVLRFGVRVRGNYFYATYPARNLRPNESYFITGGYDGDGGVRLWVNGSDQDTTSTNVSGGVAQNDSPVVIGADPQGPDNRRFFFSGVVQQVQLQGWQQK